MNAIHPLSPESGKASRQPEKTGSVSLVGAGPGAADLLTVRAVRTLRQADIVFYDSLVDDSVLDLIRPETKKVFVGKRLGFSVVPQQVIQDQMRDAALAGKRVVRLKGGDPFIFGRGGEELFDLREQGIAVSVIPGVTTALAAAAEHGIPLTHRDVSTSVSFATGHTQDGESPDLAGLMSSDRTLVLYMGITNAGKIANQLRDNDIDGSTPVAVIERATLPGQRLIRTSLETLAADIAEHAIISPALVIVGDVAALGQSATESVPAGRASEEATMESTSQSSTESGDSFAWVHHPLG